MLALELAKQVVNGNMRLGTIYDTFGAEFAAKVYDETVKRSWQGGWVRRVR